MTGPLLTAESLGVATPDLSILENVSLQVRPREIVVLIGPNGSGKTTLLRALLGLVRHTGNVERKDGLRIGYVPQHFARDHSLPMTVRRLIDIYAPGASPEALARVGIAELAEKQVASLSGGEMARVLLSRAIATKPDLLLLDEPFAGVDLAGEAALYRLIAELRDEFGCGVLLVSHDLHVVMAEASRVICLNRHICCEGAAGSVIRDPAFIEIFGPRIASELALYAHHHDHSHLPSGEVREDAHG
jgi:zinc transport system ATP-binding protein